MTPSQFESSFEIEYMVLFKTRFLYIRFDKKLNQVVVLKHETES